MIPTLEINFESYTNIPPTRFKLENVGNNVFILASMATYSELAEEQTKWLQTNYLLPQSNYDSEVEKRMQKSNAAFTDLRDQISHLIKKNDDKKINELSRSGSISLTKNLNTKKHILENPNNDIVNSIQSTLNTSKSDKKNPKEILARINHDFSTKNKKKVAIGSRQSQHVRKNSRSRSRENDFRSKNLDQKNESKNRESIKLFEGTTMTIVKKGPTELVSNQSSFLNSITTSDNQFFGSKSGSLRQWSIRNKETIREYYQIMGDRITSIAVTHDKKTVFLGDVLGNQTQFEILKLPAGVSYIKLVQQYKNLFKDPITSMAITSDNKLQLISCSSGSIKVVSVLEKKFLRTLYIDSTNIRQIKILNDCESFFAISNSKQLGQFSIENGKQLKNYSNFLQGKIEAFSVSRNEQFQYVASSTGQLLKIDINQESLLQDYGKSLNLSKIKSMALSICENFLFLGDETGKIKQLSLQDQKVNVDLVDKYPIKHLLVTGKDENLFSLDAKNNLRQWKITSEGLSLVSQLKGFENFHISSIVN